MNPELSKIFASVKTPAPEVSKGVKMNFFEIVLLVVIIVIFYWFVVKPKGLEVSELNAKLVVLQTEQETAAAQKKTLQELVAKLKRQPAEVAKLDEALPLEGKLTVVQLILEKFALDAGVNMNNANFSLSTEGPAAGDLKLLADPYGANRTLNKMQGSVAITGVLSQVQGFLQKLETSGRIFDIDSVQLSTGIEEEVVVNLNLSTYYYSE